MDTMTDVVVVGGGLAGLAATATAARAGRRVVLLDAGALGGRARSVESGGYTFNLGPHALYRGGEADRVLTTLDVTPVGQPAPGTGVARLAGRSHALPGTPLALLRTSLLRPGAKVRLARLLATLPRRRPADLAGASVDDWLDAESVTGDLRVLLLAFVRLGTYVEAPESLSAEVAVAQLQLALRNAVRYLDGGWSQLVDALTERAVAAGAHVRHSERVTAVVDTPDGPLVRTTAGELRAAAVVVAAGTPAGAAAVLGATPASWSALGPATTMSCLDLGLRRVPPTRFSLGLDDATYASVHSPPARLAPEGGAVAHLARYHRVGADPLPATDERRLLEGLAAALGIGEDDIVTARFLPRMVTNGAFPTAGGGGFAGRPPVEVPGRPGVLVAGDWVGAVGLLADAALASGAEAGARAAAHVAPTVAAGVGR